MNIPFNRPYYTGKEMEYIKDAMERCKISGDGYYTKKVNTFMEKQFNTRKALFVTSASSALDIAAILLDLQPEDEVIMPSFTFVSTANAVVLRGAKIVFADIDPKTLNVDPQDIERKTTRKTKAIFQVHYAGISCDMDKVMDIAKRYNLKVVEDAAQGVNAKYKGKYLGTIGDIGCYSFHETKNYICGEGGAILLNSCNQKMIERAEVIREKGTNRSKFYRGEVDKYTWIDIGSSYLASDILAAFLYAQYKQLDQINNLRKNIYEYYYEYLKPLEDVNLIKLPIIPKECESNYHMFYILLPTEEERDRVMEELKRVGIMAFFHYLPLHTSPMGMKMGYQKGDLPMTEEYSSRLLRLPMYSGLQKEELAYIVNQLKRILLTR